MGFLARKAADSGVGMLSVRVPGGDQFSGAGLKIASRGSGGVSCSVSLSSRWEAPVQGFER